MTLYRQILHKAHNLYSEDYKNVVVLIRPIDYAVLVNDPEFRELAMQFGLPQYAPVGGRTLKIYGYPIIITDAIEHMLILTDGKKNGQ